MQGNACCKGPQRGAAVAVRLHGDGEASLEVYWGVESIMLQRSKDFCGEKIMVLACVSLSIRKGSLDSGPPFRKCRSRDGT